MSVTLTLTDSVKPLIARGFKVQRETIWFVALRAHGTTISEPVIEAARSADGVLLGPVSRNDSPARDTGGLNPSGTLRRVLHLCANVGSAFTWPGIDASADSAIDLVIVHKKTGALLQGQEHA